MGKEYKSQLEELYTSIDVLTKHGVDVPESIVQQIRDKETEYVDKEIIPFIKMEVKDLLSAIRVPITIEIKSVNGEIHIYRKEDKYTEESSIVSESDEMLLNRKSPSSKVGEKKHQNQNRSTYSLNGGPFLNKVNFVLTFVGAILDYDPECTFKDLQELLPQNSSNNRTVLSLDEWQKKNEDAQKRYAVNHKFRTADGVEFYVSTQWTKEAFDKKLLPAVEGLGFTWEEK